MSPEEMSLLLARAGVLTGGVALTGILISSLLLLLRRGTNG